MDVSRFCSTARLIIVAGKGGVGKTTVTAALAAMAARAGKSALMVEVEGRSGLAGPFGRPGPLTYDEVVLRRGWGGGSVRARALTPDDALLEYLEDHGLRRMSSRLRGSGALDVVATAVPGIRDILVLGKVKQLERAGSADLVIVDAPAAGHAVTFLTSAQGLVDAARVGPIRTQAAEVVEMLSDPTRCQVVLVTLAEETPVNEVVETAYTLEDRVGIKLGPLVVNALYPTLEGLESDPVEVAGRSGVAVSAEQARDLGEAAAFRRRRQDLQEGQLVRLADALPLDQIRLPYLFTPEVGAPELDRLAAALADGVRGLA